MIVSVVKVRVQAACPSGVRAGAKPSQRLDFLGQGLLGGGLGGAYGVDGGVQTLNREPLGAAVFPPPLQCCCHPSLHGT